MKRIEVLLVVLCPLVAPLFISIGECFCITLIIKVGILRVLINDV